MQERSIHTDVDTQPPCNPTNTIQSVMTCPILKRPTDCTRPGPSRLSFTTKPRPKQCWRAGDPWAPLNCQDPLFRLTSLHPRQTGESIGGVLPFCRRQQANSTRPLPAGGSVEQRSTSPIFVEKSTRVVHTRSRRRSCPPDHYGEWLYY